MPLLNELLHETNPIIGPGNRGQPLLIPRWKPLTCFTVNSISPQTNLWSFTKVSMNSPSPVRSLLKMLPVSYQSAGRCKESTEKQLANKTLNRCINRMVNSSEKKDGWVGLWQEAVHLGADDVNCCFSWKNDVGEAETSILLQENIRFVVTVMKEEAMCKACVWRIGHPWRGEVWLIRHWQLRRVAIQQAAAYVVYTLLLDLA